VLNGIVDRNLVIRRIFDRQNRTDACMCEDITEKKEK
jgi:hypothetical protein